MKWGMQIVGVGFQTCFGVKIFEEFPKSQYNKKNKKGKLYMERYCIGNVYKKECFREVSEGSSFDINFGRLMSGLMDDEKRKIRAQSSQVLEEWWVSQLCRIIQSVGCEMDILNEVYLLLLAGDDKQEFLLYEQINLKAMITRGDEIIMMPPSRNINDVMKETIYRWNRNKIKKEMPIFDIQTLNSAKKGDKINSFGAGVKRLWLYSESFRRLFTKNWTRFEKYEMKKLWKILNDGDKKGIRYGIDDSIILEKLLGIDAGIDLQRHILELLDTPELEIEVLKTLIDLIVECDGLYSRRLFIQTLGFRLLRLTESKRVYDEKEEIETYVRALKGIVKLFNGCYRKAVGIYMKGYAENYTYDEAKRIIEEKRDRVSLLGQPFASQTPDYQEDIKPKIYEEIIELILKEKNDEKNAVKKLELLEHVGNRMFLCVENPFWRSVDVSEFLKSNKMTETLQGWMIQKSYEKYNERDAG